MASGKIKIRLLLVLFVTFATAYALKMPYGESQLCVECGDKIPIALRTRTSTPIVTVTSTPTPTSTKEVDLTTTPTPTVTVTPPIPGKCVYKFTVDRTKTMGLGAGLVVNPAVSQLPAWFKDIMQQAYDRCKNDRYVQSYGINAYDDCVSARLGANVVETWWNDSPLTNTDYWEREYKDLTSIGRPPKASDPYRATTYFDINGRQLPGRPPGMAVCPLAVYFMAVSPVSLIMNDAYDINSEWRITKFNLDPGKPGRWFIWKASRLSPLVVYDPEHTGKITSASQLFGNWTFGGKRAATLSEAARLDAGPWRDGYQALESLDADDDGKLSEKELEPLALWFDENQDGISQVGEVKRMDQVGIISLFFKSDGKDSSTNDLHASRGYERIVDGKIVIGRSVDWYSDSAESKESLMSKLIQRTSEIRSLDFEPEESLDKNSRVNRKAHLSGMWKYIVDSDHVSSVEESGYLTFSQNKEGRLFGHTYSYAKVSESSGDGMLMALDFYGSISSKDKIEFRTESGGMSLKNTAKLSDNGRTLLGVTSSEVDYAGKKTRVFYTWKAIKMGQR